MKGKSRRKRLLGCAGLIVAAGMMLSFIVYSWLGGWGGPHSAQLRAINWMRWQDAAYDIQLQAVHTVREPSRSSLWSLNYFLKSFPAPYTSLPNVDRLYVSQYELDMLTDLPDINRLDYVTDEPNLPAAVTALSSLKELIIESSDSTTFTLDGLNQLHNLKSLNLSGPQFDLLSAGLNPNLTDLSIYVPLVDIHNCADAFPCLRKLSMMDLGSETTFHFLEHLHDLESITILEGRELKTASGIEFCALRRLYLRNCPNLVSMNSLAGQVNLTRINFYYLPKLKDYSFLTTLSNLERLHMVSCGIESLDSLTSHPSLRSLTLQNCRDLTDYSALATLQLDSLRIDGVRYDNPQTALNALMTTTSASSLPR